MRTRRDHLALVEPVSQGILAAAALKRRLAGELDVQFVWENDLARRLDGLSTEPDPPAAWVLGLAPADSLRTLLVPALERLAERDKRVTWIARRDELGELRNLLEPHVDLIDATEQPLWKATGDADEDFAGVAAAIDGGRGDWAQVVQAACSSWEWSRIYHLTDRLAGLEPPNQEAVEWAAEQMDALEKVQERLRHEPIAEIAGRRIVIFDHPALSARVRPDCVAGARPEVDAVVFVTSPTRAIALARTGDLSFLGPVLAGGGIGHGSLAGRRADIVCSNRDALADAFGIGEARPPAGQVARIELDNHERIAKGLHRDALTDADRTSIREGVRDRA